MNCIHGSTNIFNQSFAIDPFGNLSKSGSITFAATYLLPNGTTNNQEQSVSTCVPTYDANGNMTKDCSFSSPPKYTWDSDGNPIKVRSSTLTFDALDREVEFVNGPTITQVLYSPIGKLALMNGQTPSVTRIPLPGGSTARMVGLGSATYILHTDWLGSARLSTNYSSRTMHYDTAYAPYGENYASTSTSTSDLDFTGQFQDTMNGLYDFLYREHDPVQGRWILPDPAGIGAANPANPQSWNRYAYVSNNPLSNIDPYGLVEGQECDNLNGTCSTDEAIIDGLFGGSDLVGGPETPDEIPYDLPFVWLPDHRFGDNDCQIEIDASGYHVSCGKHSGPLKPPKLFAANNGLTVSAAPPTPWYKNSCITSALGDAALHVGIDAIGLIPEAGGLARVIGHQAGYVGVVADQLGTKVIQGVGGSAGTVQGLAGLGDTSPEGLASTGLTVAGFIPGLGQAAAVGSIGVDVYKTVKAIGQCH